MLTQDHLLTQEAVAGLEQQLGEADQFDFLELLITLAKHKKTIASVTIGCVLLAFVISLFLPTMYKAKATIMPPQQSGSILSSMLGHMSAAVGLLTGDVGLKNPSDIFASILQSRTVEDSIVEQFQLRTVYQDKYLSEARKTLEGHTEVGVSKDGLISISVEDRDPRRAAAIANAYVEQLHALNQKLAVTEASQRRLLFEQKMEAEKRALADAEKDLREVQEKTGLIQLDAQGKAIIEMVAGTRAQIAAREVQLQTMQSFATPQNPDLIRTQKELAALRAQLANLERNSKLGDGNIQLPTGKVPAASLEYVRRLREVKYHEAVFEFLSKQLEAAKLDEAKDAVVIQAVDPAVPPEKKSSPQRLLIMAIAGLAALLCSIIGVLVFERWQQKRADEYDGARIDLLVSYLKAR